ncbi:HNH endonuclease signature motif containing protein [Clostridium sp.]|uniref:HNH endonuclease signature motif containing protein n=1 Tax=Clostridium sp. TaxID=1506 RepID=UPI001A3F32EB|nr:HNH endonuclease signature motif containing protein [Clostridium sp.]MBK5243345.1 HNH endonuclease [Clostridium sp.]
MEMWREIKDLPEYSVSNKGRVRKDSTGQIMVLSKNDGYSRITISKHVHRLVAEAFIEVNSDEKCWVDHVDGNRSNNDIDNLRWVTPSENCLAFGYKSRIKNRQKEIKATHLDGSELVFESRQKTAEYFKCSDSEISYGHRYTRRNKKGWILEKVEDIV